MTCAGQRAGGVSISTEVSPLAAPRECQKRTWYACPDCLETASDSSMCGFPSSVKPDICWPSDSEYE